METINNLASTAAKTIWGTGESSEEPQSGVQGDTSKGEPYDAGNMEDNKAPESQSGPTANQESSTQKGDSTKNQGDVRDPSNPQTDPKNADAAKNVDDTGDGPNDVKVDGPGPKPLEEVAKEHGGNAASGGEGDAAKGGSSGDAGEEDGPQSKSTGSGTGEQYVKSSGLKADGGDFDATKPGAGREADRLMEEKGMHKEGPGAGDSKVESSPGSETKTKKSLGQKIKDKLHKH